MKKVSKRSTGLILILVTFSAIIECYNNDNSRKPTEPVKTESSNTSDATSNSAFTNHRDSFPSNQQYPGTLFSLSHNYPITVAAVSNPIWTQSLEGKPISESNVFNYLNSLKSYVAPKLLPFLTDKANWDAKKNGWFHEPWMGSEREAILGSYLGNGNPANMFKSLKTDEAGYVIVLYDSTAAYTLGKIWGATGDKKNILNNATQYVEGSVIVKLAFSNINYPEWPAMQGSETYNIYDTISTSEDRTKGYRVRKVSFFQLDIIVKDSKTAPKTGWVYSTFVYDKDVKGSAWDKIVPLGAMWGNDPDVSSPIAPPYPKLHETVINPKAPAYSKETLGWGGRLSGPNDGAVAQEAMDVTTGKIYKNLPLSSCMSCHLPAQDQFKSFLLPGPFPSDKLIVFTPGSKDWNLWFKDNNGNTPFDAGQVATDYDMVAAFKSFRNYGRVHPSSENELVKHNFEIVREFRRNHSASRFWH